jgi:hypothetical protein
MLHFIPPLTEKPREIASGAATANLICGLTRNMIFSKPYLVAPHHRLNPQKAQ